MIQKVKNLPAMQETRVQSPDPEDPLEKEMATHSSILPWRIPWIEEPNGLQSKGLQNIRHHWATNSTIKEPTDSPGNDTQYFVITYKGKESEKDYICIPGSLCYTLETNTTW